MTKKRKLAYLALIVNTIVWGAAAPIVKPALSFITPEQFLFYRFLIASIVSIPFLIPIFVRSKFTLGDIIKIIVLELLGTTIILEMVYVSLRSTSALEASIIYSTSPLFVTLAGVFILKERETKCEWKGLFLALMGSMLITIEPLIKNSHPALRGSFEGNILMIFQNILWALYLIVAKKMYRKFPMMAVSGISFLVGLVSFYILALPSGNPFGSFAQHMSNPSVFSAVVYMAIFGSIVGATTYLFGQNLIEASEASVFTYLQALVALPLSVLWLGDHITPIMVIGGAVIALGVYIGELKGRSGSRSAGKKLV